LFIAAVRACGRDKMGYNAGPCTLGRCPAAQASRKAIVHVQPRRVSQQLTAVSAALFPALAGAASAAEAEAAAQPDNGWLSPIVDSLNFVLGNIESFYLGLGVPDAYGWSIVSLTLFVKILTLPLTKKQVESAMAVQALKPRIDVIKERYGEDKDKIRKETSRLYEQAEVNPLAGCAPALLQLPIFIGLYRSLNNIALSGTLDNEGFLWLPSLAGA
jgi:YidC/Oxa1 family membrane protein insertase